MSTVPDGGPGRLALGRDPLGWAIAAAPLAASALTLMLALLGAEAATSVTSMLAIAATAALVVADRRRIAAAKTGDRPMPSAAWFLVPPAYLWKRATALGLTRRLFWANIGFGVAAFALGIAATVAVAARQVAANQLPACDDPAALEDVVALFTEMPEAKRAGIKGVGVGSPAELRLPSAQFEAPRMCTGSMLGSDTREYPLDYSFEWRQGQVIVRIELR